MKNIPWSSLSVGEIWKHNSEDEFNFDLRSSYTLQDDIYKYFSR